FLRSSCRRFAARGQNERELLPFVTIIRNLVNKVNNHRHPMLSTGSWPTLQPVAILRARWLLARKGHQPLAVGTWRQFIGPYRPAKNPDHASSCLTRLIALRNWATDGNRSFASASMHLWIAASSVLSTLG